MKGLSLVIFLFLSVAGVIAQTNTPRAVDLATVLRLAGAQNPDVKLAGERLREAQANYQQARMKYFPWIAPGLGYKRHEGRTQSVDGEIIDASKQAASLGVSLTASLDLGDARYQALAAMQMVNAASESMQVRKQDAAYTAASAYFDLLRAQGAMGVARDAVRISEDYAGQVGRAVEAGLAFKGDMARAAVQVERNRLLLRQAEEMRDVASARLAHALRLPAGTPLGATDAELAPIKLVEIPASMEPLIARALAERPEFRELAARRAAAGAGVRGERKGRWIPELTAAAFAGGLGGGTGGDLDEFGPSSDLAIGLNWRFGPGGFFDQGALAAAESRERAVVLSEEKARNDIGRELAEAVARVRSLEDQLEISRRGLDAAGKAHAFSVQRREFGVGAVLEAVQSEQELTRARLDMVGVVAEHNKAQCALQRALGASSPR